MQTNLSMQTMQTSIWTIGSTSKGRGAGEWEGEFAKVWLPNPRVGLDCKITQFHVPFGYWSDGPDWSFHSLHEDDSLHMIHSLSILCPYSYHIKYSRYRYQAYHFFMVNINFRHVSFLDTKSNDRYYPSLLAYCLVHIYIVSIGVLLKFYINTPVSRYK